MLGYNSLFDKVTSDDLKRFYAYKGTAGTIIEELKTELSTPTLIYHPTRLIKGLIDYKVKHPEKEVIPEIIRYVVEMTKEIYSIHGTQVFKLTNLKLMCMQNGLEEFLAKEIIQEEDAAACLSSVGSLTQKTAKKVYEQTGGDAILLIPVANGATPPGIDLFLRYSVLTQSNFSTVYPCRLSAHKQNDIAPQLTEKETFYLQREAQNKTIVVFEENVVTGTTLQKITEHFQTVLPDAEIISVTNLDISKTKEASSSTSHEEMLKQFLLQYEDTES